MIETLGPGLWALLTILLASASGYAAARFGRQYTRWAAPITVLLPVLIWALVFVTGEPASEGSQFGWFMAGLIMLSPVLVLWAVFVMVAYFATDRSHGAT